MPTDRAAIATPPAATPYVIGDDARRAIAYHLLNGMPRADLAKALAAETELPLDTFVGEIDAALANPYFQGAGGLRNRVGKYQWLLQNGSRLAAGDDAALIVPELDRPDPSDVYRDHYRAHRPALIRGLIDHWPARDRWSLDYVADRLGDTPVRLQWGRDENPDYEAKSAALGTERPFSDVAARLRSSEPSNDFYITANNHGVNDAAFAPIRDDVGDIPGILAPGSARNGFIWIGPKGTVTPWHHDLTNNLLLQVVGRKRVRMVASHDTPLMRNHRHCYSQWTSADLLPGPARAGRPPVLEVVIGPGDALFLPVGWWHHVDGLDQTIGMSFTSFVWDNDFYSSYDSFGPF